MRSLILLPPSETKAPGGRRPAYSAELGSFPELAVARAELTDLLARPGALARLSPAAALRTLAAPGAATLPALQRYTGVLYDAFDAPSLPGPARRSAGSRIGIVSGLAGLVLGRDPLPDYSLPIGMGVPGIGGIGAWWRPRLSPVLDAWVEGAVVWDLLPRAHAATWSSQATSSSQATWRARWQVRVLREAADGSRTVVSHDNKATKGALARHLMLHSPRHVDELAGWVGPGGARLDFDTSVIGRRGGMLEIVTRAAGPA